MAMAMAERRPSPRAQARAAAALVVAMAVLTLPGIRGAGAGVVRRALGKGGGRLPAAPRYVAVSCNEDDRLAGGMVNLPSNLPSQTLAPGDFRKVVTCTVMTTLPAQACILLSCFPQPPRPCSGMQDGNKDPNCSWDVAPGCRSPYPVQPGQNWTFGFMTDNAQPFRAAPAGAGFKPLGNGVYDCLS